MFKETILKVGKAAETGGSIITDGIHQCCYRDLPEVFNEIDAFMAQSGEDSNHCLILRCGNSLPEALLLLWLLFEKRDFLLLPEFEDAHLPQFCKHKLSVSLDSAAADIRQPDSYVDILAHSHYRENDGLPTGSGYIFMRTSGSTAAPKLVRHGPERLFNNAADCVERFGLRSQERIMIPVPIYHMYGLGAAFLPGVIAGASINLMARTNIIRYLDREKQFRPDVSFLTPSLCEMFLQARKSAYRHRLVVTAGDRIATTTFERFEGKFGKLVNLYGSTELGAIATSTLTDSLETRADGVLAPMPAVDIRFKKLEILCRHEHGFLDYVDTQGKKVAEPEGGWFQTKDLGKPVGDRCFKVMGRAGNSINRSGILVAFAEVESIMEQGIGGVAWVVVVAGDEENRRSKRMIACCELNPHAEVDARKIRARCFALMPRHMVPDEVVVMAEIPRLANGKFDRKKLAGLFGR